MNTQAFFFYLYSAIAVAGAVGLVAARQLVHAMMSLFATLAAIAALFLVAGSEFIAAMQLFVYGGAVTVLVLFVLMLTHPGAKQQAEEGRQSAPLTRWLALGASAALLGTLIVALGRADWPATPSAIPTTAELGSVLFSRYVLPFEVAGLILTVALIGAIVLAREDDILETAVDGSLIAEEVGPAPTSSAVELGEAGDAA